MAENQNRGSEWRKWDLHIHSPFTWVNNNYPSNDKDLIVDKFINTVTDSGLDVIGLTNYFKFDNKDFEIKKRLEKKAFALF